VTVDPPEVVAPVVVSVSPESVDVTVCVLVVVLGGEMLVTVTVLAPLLVDVTVDVLVEIEVAVVVLGGAVIVTVVVLFGPVTVDVTVDVTGGNEVIELLELEVDEVVDPLLQRVVPAARSDSDPPTTTSSLASEESWAAPSTPQLVP
jgi:hypothetical protein